MNTVHTDWHAGIAAGRRDVRNTARSYSGQTQPPPTRTCRSDGYEATDAVAARGVPGPGPRARIGSARLAGRPARRCGRRKTDNISVDSALSRPERQLQQSRRVPQQQQPPVDAGEGARQRDRGGPRAREGCRHLSRTKRCCSLVEQQGVPPSQECSSKRVASRFGNETISWTTPSW